MSITLPKSPDQASEPQTTEEELPENPVTVGQHRVQRYIDDDDDYSVVELSEITGIQSKIIRKAALDDDLPSFIKGKGANSEKYVKGGDFLNWLPETTASQFRRKGGAAQLKTKSSSASPCQSPPPPPPPVEEASPAKTPPPPPPDVDPTPPPPPPPPPPVECPATPPPPPPPVETDAEDPSEAKAPESSPEKLSQLPLALQDDGQAGCRTGTTKKARRKRTSSKKPVEVDNIDSGEAGSVAVPSRNNPGPDAFPVRPISIASLILDPDCQVRVRLDEDTIHEYAETWSQGAKFPAPIAFGPQDGNYYVGDGFHRIKAAEEAGLSEIPVELRPGGKIDAIKHALGANTKHGLRLTTADKKRAILIAAEHFPNLSNNEIAALVGASNPTVATHRKEAGLLPARTIGKDGKERPSTREKSKAAQSKKSTKAYEATPTEHAVGEEPCAPEPTWDPAIEQILTMIRELANEPRETLLRLIAEEFQLEAQS